MDLRWIKGGSLVTMCYLLSIMLQEGESALTLTTSPATLTCGGTIVLTCTRNSTLSSVTWNKNSVPIIVGAPKYEQIIPGGFSATLTIRDFQKSEEDNYYCGTGFAETSQTVRITCSAPTTSEPTPPVCKVEKCCRTLVIICGIFAGITVVMWVICCLLECKKEECCQKWCCIRLIVLGFFTVIAWIFWGISCWQCVVLCQSSQKPVFIGSIVIGFCAVAAGIIWGIFCCLQYTGIIHCIPRKKEEPAFIKYAKQELQWMDQKIAKIKQNVNGGTDAAARLNKAKQERLDTCEKRCKEEEEKLSKDATNSYGERIGDYINKLRVKMSELKKIQKEGNTLVKKETKKGEIEMKEKSSELPPFKPLETEGKRRPLPSIAPSK